MRSMTCRSGAVLVSLALAALTLLSVGPVRAALPDCSGVAPVDTGEIEGLTLIRAPEDARPLLLVQAPGDRDRFFVVDQNGRIFVWKRGASPTELGVFLDLRGRVSTAANEMGLLGFAFDPEYQTTGEFYVSYTAVDPFIRSYVSRFRVSENPDVADEASEERIISIRQPDLNHNGGQVYFGPDGFLYLGLGDGGSGGDPWGECGNGQNTATLPGSILRLDVRGIDPDAVAPSCNDGVANYQVPSSNPLVGELGSCGEIWAWGIRNVWRSTFDDATGDFYAADVGQACWEEINYVRAAELGGNNYGWRQMEGQHCFDSPLSENCDPEPLSCGDSPECFDPELVLPIFEYSNAEPACSITGGYVYRGCRMPRLSGHYFYADYCAMWVRSFRVDAGVPVDERDWSDQIFPGGPPELFALTSFGRDLDGELWVVTRYGDIIKLVPPFRAIEVSGGGASRPFTLGSSGWSWEDVGDLYLRNIETYKVYRGVPNGTFECIWSGKETSFPGDPLDPEPGGLFAYIVTALDFEGEETSAGGPPGARTLDPSPCP